MAELRLSGDLGIEGENIILNYEITDKTENANVRLTNKRFSPTNLAEDAVIEWDEEQKKWTIGYGEKIFTIPRKYVHQQTSASNSWTITHNLESTAVLVMTYDPQGYFIMPGSVRITDENTVTITFAENKSGIAVVIG